SGGLRSSERDDLNSPKFGRIAHCGARGRSGKSPYSPCSPRWRFLGPDRHRRQRSAVQPWTLPNGGVPGWLARGGAAGAWAARAGESWAGAALYRRHRRMAYRIASRLAAPADRDDLVQDSFLDALANLAQLRNPELFGSWLASVVTRTAARRHRRLRRLTSL